ncbi:MAG: OmpH family outer membrane protein [Alistipes sp.]|jgi:outer membrane protein|nr:OmpH family outer membrane protein [Alistipes sp.]
MKRTIKFLLVAAFTLGSTALFAQKLGRIDYLGIIQAMPEMTTVQESLQKAETEYREHLESLQVEANRKVDEIQRLPEGTTESVRQLRQREVVELQQRYQEYLQLAQQGLEQTQMELMQPLQDKADAAIQKICKAQGIVAVFQIDQQAIYLDAEATIDITAAVRTELGITATATPATTPAQ